VNALLETRRENSDPKCASCREWEGRDTGKPAAMCERHKVTTLDLGVCTAWEQHEVLHGQIIRPDDE
jgi:hypothetical protein